jgi:hypothetical protein
MTSVQVATCLQQHGYTAASNVSYARRVTRAATAATAVGHSLHATAKQTLQATQPARHSCTLQGVQYAQGSQPSSGVKHDHSLQ